MLMKTISELRNKFNAENFHMANTVHISQNELDSQIITMNKQALMKRLKELTSNPNAHLLPSLKNPVTIKFGDIVFDLKVVERKLGEIFVSRETVAPC